MDWPSERVAKGGLFHSAKINYSKETQEMMKILMEEQRLTMLQRKKINYHLRNGDPLPPTIAEQSEKDVLKSDNNNPCYHYRSKSCRRRTLESILESDAFHVEKFVPKDAYKESSEKAKLRLQQKMSGFKEDPELAKLKLKNKYKHRIKNDDAYEFDPETEIIKEIQERIDWLDEMEKMGEAKKHRVVIQSQIQDKLAELKKYRAMQNNFNNKIN